LARGIPISLSGPTGGVTSGTFTLTYSSSDLAINGTIVDPNLAASYGATLSLDASSTPGNAIIDFSTTTALPSASSTPILLGGLTATVPSTAYYKAKDLLHFRSVSLNTATGSVAAIGTDALHLVTFAGNASGSGAITSADVLDMARVVAGADAGFAAYPLIDPDVVGDLMGDGAVDGPDGALLGRYVNGVATPQMPVYPGPPDNKLGVAGSTIGATESISVASKVAGTLRVPSALTRSVRSTTVQLGVGGSVTAPVTVAETALPVRPDLTASVVAGAVVPTKAAGRVPALGARVPPQLADGVFTVLARRAVDPDGLTVLGSIEEPTVYQELTGQTSDTRSAQAALDRLFWVSGDSSWLDGERPWLL